MWLLTSVVLVILKPIYNRHINHGYKSINATWTRTTATLSAATRWWRLQCNGWSIIFNNCRGVRVSCRYITFIWIVRCLRWVVSIVSSTMITITTSTPTSDTIVTTSLASRTSAEIFATLCNIGVTFTGAELVPFIGCTLSWYIRDINAVHRHFHATAIATATSAIWMPGTSSNRDNLDFHYREYQQHQFGSLLVRVNACKARGDSTGKGQACSIKISQEAVLYYPNIPLHLNMVVLDSFKKVSYLLSFLLCLSRIFKFLELFIETC